jgi:hypothetical protein
MRIELAYRTAKVAESGSGAHRFLVFSRFPAYSAESIVKMPQMLGNTEDK